MTPHAAAGAELLRGLTQTLYERPDLRGVLPLADVLEESVRSSA